VEASTVCSVGFLFKVKYSLNNKQLADGNKAIKKLSRLIEYLLKPRQQEAFKFVETLIFKEIVFIWDNH
jgi:hypothetical protein